jgi:formate hydrogenlyase transcriptional activator
MAALQAYDWPGNIRELQNLIERAVILADKGVLSNPLPAAAESVLAAPPPTFRESERRVILDALESVGWVVGGPRGAAAKLGLNRTTLINKMKRLRISRPRREDAIYLPTPDTEPSESPI